MNKSKNERNIPEEIKRQLRQEAGFGCCICGCPILEYHHIERFSETKRHNSDDMMAICPTCHNRIDSHTKEKQRQFKRNPYAKIEMNKNTGLIISQDMCMVSLGGLLFLGDGPLLTSKNTNYIEFYVNNGVLELSLDIYNKDNKRILQIRKNEWLRGDINIWDIKFESGSRRLKIIEKNKAKRNEAGVEIEIDARNLPVSIAGQFWANGRLVQIRNGRINVDDTFKLDINKQTDEKFGIWHLEEDAFSTELKLDSVGINPASKEFSTNSVALSGTSYRSGTAIDISKSGILSLKPKAFPYEWREGNSMKIERAEEVLIQAINTIEFYDSRITINENFNKVNANPFFNGIYVLPKEISSKNFRLKLARFYKSTGQIQKAIDTYSELQHKLHFFYKKPNIDEAELNLEMAKYLHNLGRNMKPRAQECLKEAFLGFTTNYCLPFRLLDLAKDVFDDGDSCICRSGKRFSECCKGACFLKDHGRAIDRKIQIDNLPPDGAKISLYILKTHKIHFNITKEEYSTGYELALCERYKSSFEFSIKSEKDLPFVLRVDAYGFHDMVFENVLRSGDYKIR